MSSTSLALYRVELGAVTAEDCLFGGRHFSYDAYKSYK
jgi:hypothetical protein